MLDRQRDFAHMRPSLRNPARQLIEWFMEGRVVVRPNPAGDPILPAKEAARDRLPSRLSAPRSSRADKFTSLFATPCHEDATGQLLPRFGAGALVPNPALPVFLYDNAKVQKASGRTSSAAGFALWIFVEPIVSAPGHARTGNGYVGAHLAEVGNHVVQRWPEASSARVHVAA